MADPVSGPECISIVSRNSGTLPVPNALRRNLTKIPLMSLVISSSLVFLISLDNSKRNTEAYRDVHLDGSSNRKVV